MEDAKAVPFSASAVVDREHWLELLAQLKREIPDEVRQARWLNRDKDELLERARKESEHMLAEAREQRDRLLSRTEIVQGAQAEADQIVADAKKRAIKMRLEAEDYIDQKLAAFEILLTKTLETVTRGREKLRPDRQPSVTMLRDGRPFDAAELSARD
jgi:cell division septum initiation protein DivIVA